MNQLNHQRLRAAFNSVGYSERDYVDKPTLSDTLGRLAQDDFDVDILEQLWEQCRLNSQGKTKIDTFIDNLIRAEAILLQKEKESLTALQEIQARLRQPIRGEDELNLRSELQELKEVHSDFVVDLQIIRKPFMKFSMDTVYPKNTSMLDAVVNNEDIPGGSAIIPISNKMNLTWVMDLSLLCLLAQVFITLYMNTFMNTVLFLLILSLCLFEYFDRTLIRFLFWSTIFTLLVDIIWYCIQAKSVWSPDRHSTKASFLSGYLKFSVILLSIVFLFKVLIAMLLCSQYNIDESKTQQISLLTKKFMLTNERESPIKKAIHGFLNKQLQVAAASHVSK